MLLLVTPGTLWDFDLDSLVVRRLDHALVLVRTNVEAGPGAVLDAATGEFAQLPSSPDWTVLPLALSWDGALVVLEAFRADGSRPVSLIALHSLATGTQRIYEVPRGWTHHAALSPDGGILATTDDADGSAWVNLIGLEDRTQRRLWAGDGAPSAFGWSPDGGYLAIGCEIDDGFSSDVSVVDVATGRVAAHFSGFEVLNSANGCWIGPQALVLLPFDGGDGPGPLSVADVARGDIHLHAPRPPEWTGGCHAILDGRLIQSFWDKGVYSTGLDGSNPRQLLSAVAGQSVTVVDVAPNARHCVATRTLVEVGPRD